MIKAIKIFLAVFTTFSISVSSQQFTIGKKYEIFSQQLNEKRELWIHLPKSYENKNIKPANYPVLYLLDAEINFNYFVTMADFLAKEPYAEIPEIIVVGITNTDRTRDFTPTKSSKESPFSPNQKLFENSGGNEKFLRFLETELKPYINKNFRTKDFEVLIGHSFGGLAVMNCFLKHPGFFNAYVANDPSLWWDNEILNQQFKKDLAENSSERSKTFLYLAEANNPKENHIWNKDMIQGIQNFKTIIRNAQPQFYFKTKLYTDDEHGIVSFPGNFDGLRFIFDGFRTDIKKASKNPESVISAYQKFSEKTGVEFKPSETYLNIIIDFMEKNKPENREYFQSMKNKMYQ